MKERYASWDGPLGRKVEAGQSNLAEMEQHSLALGDVKNLVSGRQEMLENLINTYL